MDHQRRALRTLPGALTAVQAVRAFAGLYCEVESGARPAEHLRSLLEPMLFRGLAVRVVRPGPAGRVIAVHVDASRADRVEGVVVTERAGRVSALVVGLQRDRRRWWIAALARPEDPRDRQPYPHRTPLGSAPDASGTGVAAPPAA